MKAHQCWFTNKMVFGMSAVPSCMPVPRTSKSFFNEYFHTISTKTTVLTYSDLLISINEFSHKRYGVWEKQSCNFIFLVRYYFFLGSHAVFTVLLLPFPPHIFFNILLPWIDSCLGHGISLSYMPIKYNTFMPRGTDQVFKALLQHQKSIILGMAEMNEGCCKWNHPGINSFVGMVTEIVPNSLSLSFFIAQRIYRKKQVMVSLCGINLFVQISLLL